MKFFSNYSFQQKFVNTEFYYFPFGYKTAECTEYTDTVPKKLLLDIEPCPDKDQIR